MLRNNVRQVLLVRKLLALWMVCIAQASAQCENDYGLTCPSSGSFSMCESGSLSGNIIFRCIDGCPTPGNCNDNLADNPPFGVKRDALCWQESASSGNAQCTADCVSVVTSDGKAIFPVGCSSQKVVSDSIAASSVPSAASNLPSKTPTSEAPQSSNPAPLPPQSTSTVSNLQTQTSAANSAPLSSTTSSFTVSQTTTDTSESSSTTAVSSTPSSDSSSTGISQNNLNILLATIIPGLTLIVALVGIWFQQEKKKKQKIKIRGHQNPSTWMKERQIASIS